MRNLFHVLGAVLLVLGLHTTAIAEPPTQSVNVANTPLDVNVANTPDVNVSNTQLDVNVTNTPDREPSSVSGQLAGFAEAQQDEEIYTVPGGERFMIETLSVTATLGSGVDPLRVGFIRNAGGIVWVPLFLQGEDSNGRTYWVGTEQVRMDVGPTGGVRFFALLSGTTGGEVLQYNVLGYLLPSDSPSLAP